MNFWVVEREWQKWIVGKRWHWKEIKPKINFINVYKWHNEMIFCIIIYSNKKKNEAQRV